MERLTGDEEGGIRGMRYERLENDGASEYARIYSRLRREGPFVDREEG